MQERIERSVCPYDCPDACGLLVEVKVGKTVKVSGDPEHPLSRGTLCIKMNHYEQTVHSPLRLIRPLLGIIRLERGKPLQTISIP